MEQNKPVYAKVKASTAGAAAGGTLGGALALLLTHYLDMPADVADAVVIVATALPAVIASFAAGWFKTETVK